YGDEQMYMIGNYNIFIHRILRIIIDVEYSFLDLGTDLRKACLREGTETLPYRMTRRIIGGGNPRQNILSVLGAYGHKIPAGGVFKLGQTGTFA
ncbi:MAG: hypothetical protein IKZ15_04810, partial [Clostridia bacterium]|nr:hypothetical protein [Clostridia bacterium]